MCLAGNARKQSERDSAWWIVPLIVVLWYLLGVISVGTSKVLLTDRTAQRYAAASFDPMNYVGGISPLFLTLQQLAFGCVMHRSLLQIKAFGSDGVKPLPKGLFGSDRDLFLAGLTFALGFWATNYSFHGSSAPFVETVKAAEPITSAGVAVLWGIEVLGLPEVISLGTIVSGVLISTLGNRSGTATVSSTSSLIASMFVVMIANLCFSFRGLHQKRFRSSPGGSAAVMDDINLQYRMQQIGVLVFLAPALVFEIPTAVASIWSLTKSVDLVSNGVLIRYVALSLVNGFAFASYNLASCYVLSRISVVHHAALNCIRRVFAIVVTSIIFRVPMTLVGAFGIIVSLCAFMSFTHYKTKRIQQRQDLTHLPLRA